MHTFIILMLVIWCGCCFASLLLLLLLFCCCCMSCFSIRFSRLFGLVFVKIVLSAASTHRTNNRKLDTFALALTYVRFRYNFVNASFTMKWMCFFFSFFFFIYFNLLLDGFVDLNACGLVPFVFFFVFFLLKKLFSLFFLRIFRDGKDSTLFKKQLNQNRSSEDKLKLVAIKCCYLLCNWRSLLPTDNA